jgi:hypothetical protein
MLERPVAGLAAFAIIASAFVFDSGQAAAQDKPAAKVAAQGCEPGFEQREYPHGSKLNFRCRTRVIDCPERQGHHVAVIPDPGFETAQGVQFGYRCQYTSRDR